MSRTIPCIQIITVKEKMVNNYIELENVSKECIQMNW